MQENVFCLGLAECKSESNVEAMSAFICSFNLKMDCSFIGQQHSGEKYLTTAFLFLSLFIFFFFFLRYIF